MRRCVDIIEQRRVCGLRSRTIQEQSSDSNMSTTSTSTDARIASEQKVILIGVDRPMVTLHSEQQIGGMNRQLLPLTINRQQQWPCAVLQMV